MPLDPSRYKSPLLADLARELLNATPTKRALFVRNAEGLHDVLGEEEAYPLDFIVFRVTGRRRQLVEPVVLVGAAAAADLRELIGDVSESIELPAVDPATDEPAETTKQLAARLSVSTRTVARWRKRGLRWRWIVPSPEHGQKQIGFTASAIERFRNDDPARVERAIHFSQITPEQRRDLLRRARRIAERCPHLSLNRVALFLSQKSGRAHETLRLLLEGHDREAPPHRVIFRDHSPPLTPRQRRVIARARRMGIPPHRIARRFRRSVGTIRRVVLERRAREAWRNDLHHNASPTFDRPDAEAVLAQPPPSPADPGGDEPGAGRSRFVHYNYLKYQASKLRERFRKPPVLAGDLERFDQLLATIATAREVLCREHRRVVESVAQRHLALHEAEDAGRLSELLAQGEAELLDTIEQYDPTRGGDFAGQLTNRLLRRFATTNRR